MKKRTICESIAYSTCLDAALKTTILNGVMNAVSCTIYADYYHKNTCNVDYYGDYQHTLRRALNRYFADNDIKKYDALLNRDDYYSDIKKGVGVYLRLATAILKACQNDIGICQLVFKSDTIKLKERKP